MNTVVKSLITLVIVGSSSLAVAAEVELPEAPVAPVVSEVETQLTEMVHANLQHAQTFITDSVEFDVRYETTGFRTEVEMNAYWIALNLKANNQSMLELGSN